MNNELVDHVMQIADSYRDARLPESAAMHRKNLAAVIGQIQQIVAMECLGAVAMLAFRNGPDSRENIYREKINKLVQFHYGITNEEFASFMQYFESWEMPPEDKEIKC